MDDPLIWVRALHFAATISVTGTVLFRAFVAEPAFRRAGPYDDLTYLRSQFTRLVWVSLAIVVLSGAAWLFLLAGQIGETSWSAALAEGVVWTVLRDTSFGFAWMARALLVAILAGALFGVRPKRASYTLMTAAGCLLAICLIGSLAWGGHAAATPGGVGVLHVASDFVHLVAAAAWAGALVPLAIVLGACCRRRNPPSATIAYDTLRRFSTWGMLSVGTLLVTGMINSWVLVGSVSALVRTDYGRLLLVKISLFFVMLLLAAVNRLRLTPIVVERADALASLEALRKIQRNGLLETTAGLLIIIIVGWLGTIPPGSIAPM